VFRAGIKAAGSKFVSGVALGLMLAQSIAAHASWTEKAYAAPSRPGVEQVFVMATESTIADRNAVKNVVVMLPGGAGAVAPPLKGELDQIAGNRIVMRGVLAEQLGVVAVVGLPSDQNDGISIDWREGPEHVKDVGAVIDVLTKQYPEARVTVLGYSNGAVSATHIGAVLGVKMGTKLQAVVLMSAASDAFRSEWIGALEALKPKVPVLVVHHKRDSCLQYADIEDLARWHALITVDDPNLPRVNRNSRRDCGPGSGHQFAGKEKWVYQAVADWIKTGKLPVTN
jgi:alpha/beta superfamily hydrolase